MVFQGKYIIVNDSMPILFLECLQHSTVAKGFPKERISSAGFFRAFVLSNGELDVSCYGESITLNQKSMGEDSDCVKRFIKQWLEGLEYLGK